MAQNETHQENYHKESYTYMHKALDRIWAILPNYVGTVIATILIFIAGSAMKGDWMLILVYLMKYINHSNNTENVIDHENVNAKDLFSNWSLEKLRLQGLPQVLMINVCTSYTIYFILCGFLQWYFYIKRRDTPHEWKCQPLKFLSPEQERHEMILGTVNVGFGVLTFGTLSCFVKNGGYTTLYYQIDQYGWVWLLLSIPISFLYQDLAAYYVHRTLHLPFMYKYVHKWHHYYKQPTAFSVTAMHPIEILFFQIFMILPVFFMPLHALVYVGNMLYIYYYGVLGHSGIDLEAFWPWQNNTMFHDNHHQFFHVNFGSNLSIWDKWHGTHRKKGRIYNEKIFGGKGVDMTTATEELQKEHENECKSENRRRNHKVEL